MGEESVEGLGLRPGPGMLILGGVTGGETRFVAASLEDFPSGGVDELAAGMRSIGSYGRQREAYGTRRRTELRENRAARQAKTSAPRRRTQTTPLRARSVDERCDLRGSPRVHVPV